MVWNPSRLKPKMMEAIEVFWLKVPLKITKAQILETLTKPLICITWIVWRNWGLKPASIKVQWWPLRQPVVSDPPILTPPVIIAFQQPHRPRLNLIVQEAIILSQPVRPIPNQHPQLWQPRVNNLVEILMWILFVKDWSELDEITEWWFWSKYFCKICIIYLSLYYYIMKIILCHDLNKKFFIGKTKLANDITHCEKKIVYLWIKKTST